MVDPTGQGTVAGRFIPLPRYLPPLRQRDSAAPFDKLEIGKTTLADRPVVNRPEPSLASDDQRRAGDGVGRRWLGRKSSQRRGIRSSPQRGQGGADFLCLRNCGHEGRHAAGCFVPDGAVVGHVDRAPRPAGRTRNFHVATPLGGSGRHRERVHRGKSVVWRRRGLRHGGVVVHGRPGHRIEYGTGASMAEHTARQHHDARRGGSKKSELVRSSRYFRDRFSLP